jgi:NADPH:quinone reductase-like Zn-dependent oxidoreductase
VVYKSGEQRAHTDNGRRVSRATFTTPQQDIQESPSGPSPPPGPGEILVRVQACGLDHGEGAVSTGVMSQLSACDAAYVSGINAAGTVIAAGDRVTRFAVGDDVFGQFVAESWASAQAPFARTTADGPHVERRPEGLDPAAAAALAHDGLTAKTILRAADLRPGHTALVLGATSRVATVLVPLLADAGAHVIAGAAPDETDYVRALGAADTIQYTTADPVTDALASHPDADLLIDLVSFGEPYFITAAARHGTIVTTLPRTDEPGVPRIPITAEPGDLTTLVQHALNRRAPIDLPQGRPIEPVAPGPPANPATSPRRLRGAARTINRNLGKIVRARLSNV